MTDLNKELSEYLLSNKNEKQYKLSIPSVSLPKSTFKKWLGRSNDEEEPEDAGWFENTQKKCCPSLVSLTQNYLTAV